jgi:hypothetical protein
VDKPVHNLWKVSWKSTFVTHMALILCVGDKWDRREQVLKHRLVPALLLGVPATAALSASTAFVQAAEECRVKPQPGRAKGQQMALSHQQSRASALQVLKF